MASASEARAGYLGGGPASLFICQIKHPNLGGYRGTKLIQERMFLFLLSLVEPAA
jgi:hypothetical protein